MYVINRENKLKMSFAFIKSFDFARVNFTYNNLILQHLNNLLENYLEPLKQETFLSGAEIAVLFGNIQEIVQFQHQFLQNLEDALHKEPNFHKFDQPEQFKVNYY